MDATHFFTSFLSSSSDLSKRLRIIAFSLRSSSMSSDSWAIRFAAGLPGVETVLSGMNAIAQIEENLSPQTPLTVEELDALESAATRIRAITAAPCTGCGYCLPGCPRSIPIPNYLALYNEYARNPGENWKMEHIYWDLARRFAPADACLDCGACTGICPQHLDIPAFLQKTAAGFPPE